MKLFSFIQKHLLKIISYLLKLSIRTLYIFFITKIIFKILNNIIFYKHILMENNQYSPSRHSSQ